jgi:hypothetical protein
MSTSRTITNAQQAIGAPLVQAPVLRINVLLEPIIQTQARKRAVSVSQRHQDTTLLDPQQPLLTLLTSVPQVITAHLDLTKQTQTLPAAILPHTVVSPSSIKKLEASAS